MGKRKNAGRKCIYDMPMLRKSGRMTQWHWDILQAAGGFGVIRRMIEYCLIFNIDPERAFGKKKD